MTIRWCDFFTVRQWCDKTAAKVGRKQLNPFVWHFYEIHVFKVNIGTNENVFNGSHISTDLYLMHFSAQKVTFEHAQLRVGNMDSIFFAFLILGGFAVCL